jgi:hypothetical protein
MAAEPMWAAFESLTENHSNVGWKTRLVGRVNLVRIVFTYVNSKGSFTLTTGFWPIIRSRTPPAPRWLMVPSTALSQRRHWN